MARTKLTARKSIGGKAPRRTLTTKATGKNTSTIMKKDDAETYFSTALASNAHKSLHETITSEVSDAEDIEHVVVVDTKAEDAHDISCEHCEHYKVEITKIMTTVKEIQKKQQEDAQNITSKAEESDANIRSLLESNNKMADEIASLKSTVEELTSENKIIRRFLDIKQNDWTKIETKKTPKTEKVKGERNPVEGERNPDSTNSSFYSTKYTNQNRFNILPVEGSDSSSRVSTEDKNKVDPQILDYRSKQKSKFINSRKSQTDPISKKSKIRNNIKPNQTKKVLVIGDSMVKHIDNQKVERAARGKAVCHSYSGATVDQLKQKIQSDWCEEQDYDSVVVHVGTNDLVHKQPEEVAKEMERLIDDIKPHAKKIALSSVVRRYDGKVQTSKINRYNSLLHDLCFSHSITFIDNDCIGQSLLNRSNLHLNRNGDRVLGSAFCTYLKSDRVESVPAKNNEHFFRAAHGHQRRDWTMYLEYVNKVMK